MKRVLGIICILLTAVLILIMVVRSVNASGYNSEVTRDFKYAELQSDNRLYQYRDQVPVEEMNFQPINAVMNETVNPVGSDPYKNEFVLPFDLKYYEKASGKTAMVLKKGTVILADYRRNGLSLQDMPMGYGFFSYPTYSRGWRYAEVFKTTETVGDLQHEMYFVKLSDLEKLMGAYLKEIGHPKADDPEAAAVLTYERTDKILFNQQIYCSPDLTKSVFDGINIILLIAAVICAAGAVFCFIRKR